MAALDVLPTSPQEWEEYANYPSIVNLPLRYSHHHSGADEWTTRDVYVDASKALDAQASLVTVCADVLAFTHKKVALNIQDSGNCSFFARVITASAPVHIQFVPATHDECSVFIYASALDQPVTYSYTSGASENLNLGRETGNVGAEFTLQHGRVTKVDYKKSYSELEFYPRDFRANLRSQLRIASILFWRRPSIATSLASYVMTATADTIMDAEMNAPALALVQQLAGQALAGLDTSFAPPLQLDSYIDTLNTAITTAEGFQQQYDRFVDRELTLKDKLAAWEAMLNHAKGAWDMNTTLRDTALGRYQDACDIVDQSMEQFAADQDILQDVQERFKTGIQEWKERLERQAIIEILTAVVTFAVAIGAICMGDPAGLTTAPAQVEDAIQAAETAEKLADTILKSGTLKKLKQTATMGFKLYGKMDTTVEKMKELQNDPNAKIPTPASDDDDGAADAKHSINLSLPTINKWQLESDEQLAFAIDQKIDGAAEYRLELRKHAINGKLLAQSQAQAVKAGQEYVRAQLEYTLGKSDIDDLTKLKDNYKEEEKQAKQAESMFYDRLLAIRTSILIELRNVAWAYKYYALQDSSIKFDLLKSMPEFRQDVLTIKQEVENANSRYSSDNTPFRAKISSMELPLNYAAVVVESLKNGHHHQANFTLDPLGQASSDNKKGNNSENAGNDVSNVAGPFIDGSHFRVEGLDVVLHGAIPKPESLKHKKTVEVTIIITTSGVYADIKDGKVFHFTILPLERHFVYEMKANGKKKKVVTQSTFPSTTHADPTPFTRWTIRIKNAEDLDLSGLTDIGLKWTGSKDFDGDGKDDDRSDSDDDSDKD